ncbi:MAG: hypothetical protein GHCLOJNM_02114 [bacterium]|nr:hypothetical protein [bacterium]
MIAAIRKTVTIQPGGTIETRSPELPEGGTAEVIVLAEQQADKGSARFSDLFGIARGLYGSTEEIDDHIRKERDSWES